MKKYLPPPAAIVALLIFVASVANAQLNISLTKSDYHGYNISCFGMKDGNITLNVSGGTPPYIFTWSNGDTTSSVNNLPAGFYSVRITDSLTNDTTLQITLTEPEPLAIGELNAYRYANGFNVSSFGACNGSVTTTVSGGVLPYTYFWKPGQQTLLTPVNLCGGENVLTVTDLNGCEVRNAVYLKEPQRDDWTMTGNAGSNPNFNFIGTSDSIDFVFKTNNTERMKIGSDGKVNIPSFADTSYHLLMTDNDGNLVKAIPIPGGPSSSPFWLTTGNNNIQNSSFIGPTNNKDFIIKTGDAAWGTLQERVRVTTTGKVGIGVAATNMPGNYKLYVADGILTEQVKVSKNNPWPDYVFEADYNFRSISETEQFIKLNKRLPGIPDALTIEKEGQNLGELQVLQQEKLEELYLHIIALEKRIKALEEENGKLKKK